MRIRGLLFDKDGTLVDVVGTWLPVYREMLAEAFPGQEDHWSQLLIRSGYDPHTNGFKANSPIAVGTTDQLVDLWWPGLSREQRQAMIGKVDRDFEQKSVRYLQPLMPLAPLLDELRSRSMQLGIATNDNEASARKHVSQLQLEHLIDFVAGYDTVRNPKPAGDMVHAFCAACALRPEQVAVVGDNRHDLEMARSAGAGLAIGVMSGGSAPEDFGSLADAVLASIAELPDFLQRN
ncbi:MAG TPA: HAD family hydrolase [Aestuariivirgaceae bacterium]|jgi:phosphoglycolate phosphatase